MGVLKSELAVEFEWARALTVDMLREASPNDLMFQLGSAFGPLWKQFRHIGRVHENYLKALQSLKIAFGVEGCTYSAGCSKDGLISYFDTLQKRHNAELQKINDCNLEINWYGEKTSLELHLTRLLSHETLHHGQLILYWRSMGRKFPEKWQAWGET